MELSRFLYNDLAFQIKTGLTPTIVNAEVVQARTSVPHVVWNMDFGLMNTELKNAVEHAIFSEPNSLYIKAFIGPAFYIGKRVDPVDSSVKYFLSYVFEYEYYSSFVNKELNYVVDGSYHVLDNGIHIPSDQVDGDPLISITKSVQFNRKLFFVGKELTIQHTFNGQYKAKANFIEQAAPVAYTNIFIVGGSNVNYDIIC